MTAPNTRIWMRLAVAGAPRSYPGLAVMRAASCDPSADRFAGEQDSAPAPT